jgi:predicted RNA-binding protein YlxR (DUF448 family)
MAKKQAKGRRRHVPMRTCIVCRESRPKRSLVRVVAVPEKGLVIDPSGKLAGRGAYLCRNPGCWELAVASRDLMSRALRMTVVQEDKGALEAFLEEVLRAGG